MKRALVCLAIAAGSAHAGFWDGNRLHKELTGNQAERLLGLGYIMGVADALQNAIVCAPGNVNAGQMRDMVANYLANVPAERHLPADSIVAKVLRSQWPCSDKPAGGTL